MSDTPGHLTGLIGSGIGPSLSPALHHREADALGIRYLYRRFDLDPSDHPGDAFGELLRAARACGFDGLNITHPYKRLATAHLDELSPDAAALNAVNTVVFGSHGAVGHNTDWSGFARALDSGLPDAPLGTVVLLGAGGAGSAVAHALSTLGAGSIHIADADPDRSSELAEAVNERCSGILAHSEPMDHAGMLPKPLLDRADGLVQATPTGMAEHPGMPIPAESLRAGMWVAEVVYRPLRTELVRAALARGCRVLDGGRMAVFQAADSFRLFTGVEPDAERMLRHFARLTETEGTNTRVRG
ncbi:shikimate dehydrogenase [Actinopolyspora mzabensis]|uniref:Shikimate dehydrogenase (NADP(+)) n=1 Tax=Actinopolyspora mzabensis TaxID=995066 RepID=A0A1G9EK96_ACTMZ|nr:shikimate dehydrogenase [Actinopolyspora mzabensis]SDK76445.1 shikimate dehydrogenase [Actinopolyspora mzabensis]